VTLHTPGFTTEVIHANRGFAGDRLLREDDLRFDEFHVCFTDLPNWIRMSGIRTEWPKQPDAPITFRAEYCKAHDIRLTFAGRTLSLGFQFSISSSRRSVILREKAVFRISGLDQLAIDQIRRQYLQPLHNFITFAADFPNAIDEFVVFNTRLRLGEANRPCAIHALGQPVYVRADAEKPRDADAMLFTYDDVREFLGDLLNRWMTFSERFSAFTQVYFSSLYGPGAFVEERFMSAVRALILLLAETVPKPSGVGQAIDEMRDRLSQAAGERGLRWVREIMPAETELGFPWRLSGALTKYESLLSGLITPDIERFVDAIVATRRYVSCPDELAHSNVLQGSDLHWTTEKLNALIKVCVLDWLEFPRELIAKLLNRNSSFLHLKSVPQTQTG
jgi:hypothetical protein